MKFTLPILLIFFANSLLAADCKYFKDQFIGNFKVVSYECHTTVESDRFQCYLNNDTGVSILTSRCREMIKPFVDRAFHIS